MDKEKVLQLAKEAEILRQLSMEVPFVVDRLERFAALIEREVRGDAEPVGFDVFTEDGRVKFRVGNQYFTLEYNFEDKDELRFMQNMLVSALGKLSSCPAPAVVQQLVDGLTGIIDFIEIDNLKIDQDAFRIAKAALAAVKEAGYD